VSLLLLAVSGAAGWLVLARPRQKEAPERPEPGPPAPLLPRLTNSLGMEFVLVRKGKFKMGGGGGKPGTTEVQIGHDFYLGVYEVTQGQWQAVRGNNPSHFSRKGPGKDAVAKVSDAELKRFPVEMVSWDDTQVFLKALNQRDKGAGWSYRLPTGAEWEYACRGGPPLDSFLAGFDFYLDRATSQLLPGQANFAHPGGLNRTCPVGSYRPNRLGLYDMHGNVFEWCHDPPKEDREREHRGGCWEFPADDCRAGEHRSIAAKLKHPSLGLRVARVPK
jgi:formylglycine-generating enzyme required for sulfatase activity